MRISICINIGLLLGFITALFLSLIRGVATTCVSCSGEMHPGLWELILAGVIFGIVAGIIIGIVASVFFHYRMWVMLIISLILGILTGIISGITAMAVKEQVLVILIGELAGIFLGWLVCSYICGRKIPTHGEVVTHG